MKAPLVAGSSALVAATASLAAALFCGACGPSFQAIYEGDARFEHCYALDENPDVPMQRKGECWQDWADHYTYGQTRDRVQYARMRHRALSRVPVIPTDEAMMQAAPGVVEPSTRTVTAPAPTSAFAPPPTTHVASDAGAPEAPPSATAPVLAPAIELAPPPGAACAESCTDAWRTCARGCAGKACDKCERTHRRCMSGCYREGATPKPT
jgi:hypothetical protein